MIQFETGEPSGGRILAHVVWGKDYDYYAILTNICKHYKSYSNENGEDVPLQCIKEWAEF
jgi:hypothetical protein